jgi:hypothetical protein
MQLPCPPQPVEKLLATYILCSSSSSRPLTPQRQKKPGANWLRRFRDSIRALTLTPSQKRCEDSHDT